MFSVAVVQSLSCVWLCDPIDCSTPGLTSPSPSPRVCSNSCPLSRWCYLTISSSSALFSFCLQSPSIRFFSNKSALCIKWQSIIAPASTSGLPMNILGWFPLGLTGLISLQFRGLSRVFSSTTIQMHQLFSTQPSLWSNSHISSWLLEKP